MRERTQQALTEAEVQDMRALEPSRRNRLLLRLLYSTGLRPSELCSLCWRDVHETDDAGQVVIVGKSGQLRFVPLRVPVWEELQAFRGRAGDLEPIFRSHPGGPLSPRRVDQIVRRAARRAHMKHPVSPRLLRYARPRQ
jgi:site-specific recombinase XerD